MYFFFAFSVFALVLAFIEASKEELDSSVKGVQNFLSFFTQYTYVFGSAILLLTVKVTLDTFAHTVKIKN